MADLWKPYSRNGVCPGRLSWRKSMSKYNLQICNNIPQSHETRRSFRSHSVPVSLSSDVFQFQMVGVMLCFASDIGQVKVSWQVKVPSPWSHNANLWSNFNVSEWSRRCQKGLFGPNGEKQEVSSCYRETCLLQLSIDLQKTHLFCPTRPPLPLVPHGFPSSIIPRPFKSFALPQRVFGVLKTWEIIHFHKSLQFPKLGLLPVHYNDIGVHFLSRNKKKLSAQEM